METSPVYQFIEWPYVFITMLLVEAAKHTLFRSKIRGKAITPQARKSYTRALVLLVGSLTAWLYITLVKGCSLADLKGFGSSALNVVVSFFVMAGMHQWVGKQIFPKNEGS